MNSDNKDKQKKRPFSNEEDQLIRQLVQISGEKAWKFVAYELINRSPRQCRERWKNYLSPAVKNLPWTTQEDQLLEGYYHEFGTQWAKIASKFDARSDVNVKNRFAFLRRKENRLSSYQKFTPEKVVHSQQHSKRQSESESTPQNSYDSSPANNNYSKEDAKTELAPANAGEMKRENTRKTNEVALWANSNKNISNSQKDNYEFVDFWDAKIWDINDENMFIK